MFTIKRMLSLIIFLIGFLMLFLGFYRNQWGAAREKKFNLFQRDVESYVIARMVLSRQSGPLSYGGLLGWGDVNPADIHEQDYEHQYETYLEGRSFETYLPKESHPGLQGLLFSLLDRVSPYSPANNLRLFRALSSGLFAATLILVVAWFSKTLGWLPALFVFGSILSSQWLTLFGRNLFFFSWIFYVPFVLLLWQLEKESEGKALADMRLFWLVFALILLKCLFNGYDFVLPTLGMTACPILFYGFEGKWEKRRFFKRFAIVALASLLAIFTSLLILAAQNMIVSGSFQEGLGYIIQTYKRRTLAIDPSLPSIYAEAQRASTWSILEIYLTESYFSNLGIPYYVLILVFLGFSLAYLMLVGIRADNSALESKGKALLAITWLSILSPLSWYIIFKSVAYFHTHMNYLPFHMPFTLFGFAVCGFTIESVYRKTRRSLFLPIKLPGAGAREQDTQGEKSER